MSAADKTKVDGIAGVFQNIAVSGQTTVVADAVSDTLTLAAGANITLTTNATTDTITIASAGTGGTNTIAFGGPTHNYYFGTTTTNPPAAGGLRANNSTLSAATTLWVSDEDGPTNQDITAVLQQIKTGDVICIESTTTANSISYNVTGTPTDSGAYFTIPVSVVPGYSATLAANEQVEFWSMRNPSDRIPLGGTTGQVLTKNSATNYDVAWAAGGGGTSDHGALTGLADDDHAQYHTDARGDARYPPLARTVSGLASVAGGGDLTSNRAFSLVNDAVIPGPNQVYGTDDNGERGWYSRATAVVLSGTWRFMNATNPGGGGSIARNNTTPSAVTQLFISETDDDYLNQSAALAQIGPGTEIAIRLESDQSMSVICKATGPATDTGSNWTVPVAYVSGGGSPPADNTRVDVDFVLSPPGDHGSLIGLGDDDHTQYHNNTRGDARYLQLTGGSVSGAITMSGGTAAARQINNAVIDCGTF